MTFRQTAFTDGDTPTNTALSSPILIDITNDDIFEGMEYFPARIVETSDRFRVRIGQDTVNVTIKESELCLFGLHVNPNYISLLQLFFKGALIVISYYHMMMSYIKGSRTTGKDVATWQ